MVKTEIFILAVILLIPLAAASDVAYIYESEGKIDWNIINVFSELGLTVDKISQKSLPDLSQYKFIFLGDENIGENISINKYPSIVAGYYLGEKTGLTDKDGTSKLASTMPLKVKFKGQQIQVYTSGRDARGTAIPYYFLDNENKAPGLIKYAGTYSTSSGKDFGDVISLAGKGDILYTGETVESGICFFGIIKSDYWTPEAKNLFLDCIKYVYDYTANEIACSTNQDCVTFSMLDSQPFCQENKVVQKITIPKCVNPGQIESYCSYEEVQKILEECSFCVDGNCGESECNNNEDCNDGFLFTEDTCLFPGTENSTCSNDFINNLELITVVAVASPNSIILNFYHNYSNLSGVKGYYLSEGTNWTFLEISNSSYEFNNLKASTDYVFTIQIVDYSDFVIQELIVNIKTAPLPGTKIIETFASGGGRGGACMTKWECTEWGECIDNLQTRICSYPEKNCKPTAKKPIEIQECISTIPVPEETVQSEEEVHKTPTQGNSILPITGASVSIPDILTSDNVMLVAAVSLMGLIIAYFLLSSPKK